jgi:hypothetical protein
MLFCAISWSLARCWGNAELPDGGERKTPYATGFIGQIISRIPKNGLTSGFVKWFHQKIVNFDFDLSLRPQLFDLLWPGTLKYCAYVKSLVALPLATHDVTDMHLCFCKSFAKIVPIRKNYDPPN